jgi:integrase
MTIRRHRAKDGTTTYGVRIHRGGGKFEWVGTYRTVREARIAQGQALAKNTQVRRVTVQQLADEWMARYERTRKLSSVDTAKSALGVFCRQHGPLEVSRLDRAACERFAVERDWAVPVLVTLFRWAETQGIVERSPFRGLSRRRSVGRRDLDPLTVEEVDRLAQGAAHGRHGGVMRAWVLFAAYTGLRPGEQSALEWRDVDLEQARVAVRRRLYRGRLDQPKTGQRQVALPPPARDALIGIPRINELVFPAARGGRISQSALTSYYWPPASTALGRHVDPYELRHFCGHYLYVTSDLPSRVVAAQLGHSSPRKVEELYGHFKVGALDEIDRAFGHHVVPLRRLDTGGAHGAA